MQEGKKVIISLSGGMDSSTLLSLYLYREYEVDLAVSFHYGSKHNKWEMNAAKKVTQYYKIPWLVINAKDIFSYTESNLLQSGGAIPEGHYEDASMKKTVVPGRNLIFASILSSIAESRSIDIIALAVHSGDHAIYPDCRPAFMENLYQTISDSTEDRVSVQYPFIDYDKRDILRMGIELETPYHLTRTCYKDQPVSCGKCGSCIERLEAFEKLSVTDPIPYEKG